MLAASASLAAGAVIAAALHVKINLLKPRAGRTALRRGLDRTSRKLNLLRTRSINLMTCRARSTAAMAEPDPRSTRWQRASNAVFAAAKTMSPRSEYFSEFLGTSRSILLGKE